MIPCGGTEPAPFPGAVDFAKCPRRSQGKIDAYQDICSRIEIRRKIERNRAIHKKHHERQWIHEGSPKGETLMRKIASIGFAIGALTVTALPVRADDQSIYFATGAIGGQQSAFRATPWVPPGPGSYGRYPYAGYAYSSYGGYPYGGYAPSDGYAPQNCTYIGGPKGSNWTCW